MKKFKRSFVGGDLRMFSNMLKIQKEDGANFKVISSGLSKTLIFDTGIKYNYFSNDKGSRVEGAYFVNMVRSSIDKYIDKNGLQELSEQNPNVQTFNLDGIALAGDNEITCLDLNSCYWRSAFLLGYIDEVLYEKGVKSGFKKGLLISIGSLNKLKHIEKYENGVKVGKSTIDEVYRERYAPFYWNIISKVRDLMMQVYDVLGDEFYMWLTDCAFINPDCYDKVKEVFDSNGYPFKEYKARFTKFDGITVYWDDYKAEQNKQMPISNREIQNDYLTWKTLNNFQLDV